MNRRVHCRNHSLGCNVMIRLKERMLHEYVDGMKAIRSSLYLSGHGTYIAIKEGEAIP